MWKIRMLPGRAFEVTHGNQNGFHPHFHILVFTEDRLDCSTLLQVYANAWKRACRLAGLPEPSDEHGVTVQDGSQAAQYASKPGAQDFLTRIVLEGSNPYASHWNGKVSGVAMPPNAVAITEGNARQLVSWILSLNK